MATFRPTKPAPQPPRSSACVARCSTSDEEPTASVQSARRQRPAATPARQRTTRRSSSRTGTRTTRSTRRACAATAFCTCSTPRSSRLPYSWMWMASSTRRRCSSGTRCIQNCSSASSRLSTRRCRIVLSHLLDGVENERILLDALIEHGISPNVVVGPRRCSRLVCTGGGDPPPRPSRRCSEIVRYLDTSPAVEKGRWAVVDDLDVLQRRLSSEPASLNFAKYRRRVGPDRPRCDALIALLKPLPPPPARDQACSVLGVPQADDAPQSFAC